MLSESSTYLFSENATVNSLEILLQHTDSVKSISQAVHGFAGIPHFSFPQTENWVFGVLLGLFFLLVFSIRLYPSFIYEDIHSIFKVKERSSIFSNPEGSDSRLRILYIIFSFCVISLYAYFITFKPGEGSFAFLKYCRFLTATIIFFLVKHFFIWLLNYVFFDKKTLEISVKSYYNLIVFSGITLFPLLIFNIYSPATISAVAEIASLIVCLIIATFIILKLFQIFFSKLLDSFYILLYLCTLEILPVLALFQVYEMIV